MFSKVWVKKKKKGVCGVSSGCPRCWHGRGHGGPSFAVCGELRLPAPLRPDLRHMTRWWQMSGHQDYGSVTSGLGPRANGHCPVGLWLAGPPQGQRPCYVIPGRRILSDSALWVQLKKTESERKGDREEGKERERERIGSQGLWFEGRDFCIILWSLRPWSPWLHPWSSFFIGPLSAHIYKHRHIVTWKSIKMQRGRIEEGVRYQVKRKIKRKSKNKMKQATFICHLYSFEGLDWEIRLLKNVNSNAVLIGTGLPVFDAP